MQRQTRTGTRISNRRSFSGCVMGRVPGSPTRLVGALWLLAAAAGPGLAQESFVRADLLDNGDFAQGWNTAIGRLPWWVGGDPGRPPGETAPGTSLRQPVPAFAPLLREARLTGHVDGPGRVSVTGGSTRYERDVEGAFEVTGEQLQLGSEGDLGPRLMLELNASGDEPVRWSNLAFEIALPDLDPAQLRAELEAELAWALEPWMTRGLDDEGERRVAFIAREVDAVTGEAGPLRATAHPYNLIFAEFLMPLVVRDAASPWAAELERYLDDFLELGLHPVTGLPRLWQPAVDRPADGTPIEVAACLRFVIDVWERGPEGRRPAFREAALRMGETILLNGVMPDGTVAPTYRPADGTPYFDVPPIRRLDVPAQLARIAALTGDDRYRRAARDASLEVEYTLYWPGEWDSIDPGFDDTFGHLGERGVVMWRALPDEPVFQRIVLSGWERYRVLWRDALTLGGNVAADQVRCWRIAAELAQLAPVHAPEVAELLDLAVRSHFKGGQGESGAWIDVTIVGFSPQHLPVGDTGGVPQNLLAGLAVVYAHPELGLATPLLRARFTTVARSTRTAYGEVHGLIGTARRREGANSALGSIRYAVGVAAMLEALGESP